MYVKLIESWLNSHSGLTSLASLLIDFLTLMVLTLTLFFVRRYVKETTKLSEYALQQVDITQRSLDLLRGRKENPFKLLKVVKSDDGNTLFSLCVEIDNVRIRHVRKCTVPAGDLEVVPGRNKPIKKGHTFGFSIPKRLDSKLPHKFDIHFRHGETLKNHMAEYEYDGKEFWLLNIRWAL